MENNKAPKVPTIVPIRFNKNTIDGRGYDIVIGKNILANPERYLLPLLSRAKVAIVTDTHLAKIHLDGFAKTLEKAGIVFHTIILPAGEASKSFDNLELIVSRLLSFGIERTDSVIAFGGGVIGDITGFACSMVRRGCQFIQIPTTLLAQVDSSVGGKTAINTEHGKNLAGAFYQPQGVLTDITTLKSLPMRQRKAGYAEILKYGLLGNAGFFEWLDKDQTSGAKKPMGQAILDLEEKETIKAIEVSCRMKGQIVEEDEREHGRRALLNLGHTFGHALEGAFGFSDTLLHGEGVAIGMALAFEYGATHGMIDPAQSARVKSHLVKLDCPAHINDIKTSERLNADQLVELMMQDKKVVDGKLTLILPTAIGSTRIVKDAPVASVHAFWQKQLSQSNP